SPALTGQVFETHISLDQPAFLSHHRIHGVAVLPSPAYLEMLLGAGTATHKCTPTLTGFEILDAMILSESGVCVVQTILTPDASGATAQIFSRAADDTTWRLHVNARLAFEPVPPPEVPSVDLNAIRSRCGELVDHDTFYARLAALGLEFGESFRGLREIYRCDGEALGLMELPDTLTADIGTYDVHPALLDSCFHLLGAALHDDQREHTYLMIAIDHFRVHRKPGARFWNHVTLHDPETPHRETFSGDLRLYDEDGTLLAEALGLHLKLASPEMLERSVRRQHNDLFYEVAWQHAPSTSAQPMQPVDIPAIARAVEQLLGPLASEHGLNVYEALIPALDDLATSYVTQTLRAIGMSFASGTSVDIETLVQRTGIPPRHTQLLARMLEMLEVDGILRRDGAVWRVMQPPTVSDPDSVSAALLRQFASADAEIRLTTRCGAALADVLTGEANPLQVLFPNGSQSQLEPLYRTSPSARVFNRLVGAAIRAAVDQLPHDRRLRILEIGAGTGATTDHIVAALPTDRIDYWFTDVSPLFVDRARERLGENAGFRFEVFDLEQDPDLQGIPTGEFDIIVAANVFHATTDVSRSLENARSLLAPGGVLVLLEGTQPRRWIDISFGLTDGWWRFSDHEIRHKHPLLTREAWQDALCNTGFTDPAIIGYSADSAVDQVVIVTRAPAQAAATSANWFIVPDATGVGATLAGLLRSRGEQV
ncbi:MAG TPA: polyketide synthase dehydratase domain-containing protein, partial [Thermomicrobiales bacterium]|nr:polyketide synthase dehydratase domain-containing protein [Thermomicrobiales bacterium]